MKNFFFPKSIALFGASNSPTNLGRTILDNMDRLGFNGTIYLIGGKDRTVAGRHVFADVRDLDEVPDLAVFLIPIKGLPEALRACGEKGIRSAVIETAGFSEFREDRAALEKEVLDIASKWGMRFMGPNCVGVLNTENWLSLPFFRLSPEELTRGNVSVIAQSGGLVHDIMTLFHGENIGISKLISMGNALMLRENDYLEYLIADRGTKIIGMYLETVSDGRRLMRLAASTDKPIILVKANSTLSSQEIARFHTTSLAGDDLVLDAAVKQAGVHRVTNLREMADCVKAFSLPAPSGPRLALLTRSGGHAVLAADAVSRHGFELAPLSAGLFDLVRKRTRAGVIRTTNPLDLGDIFDIGAHAELTEKALQEKDVDGVVFIHGYAYEEDLEPTERFLDLARELSFKYTKPLVFCMIAHKDHWFAMRKKAGYPIFGDVDDALSALSRALTHARNRLRIPSKVAQISHLDGRRKATLSESRKIMSADESFRLLAAHGLSVADYAVVKGPEEGIRAAEAMGYPVALKIASSGVLHKTEKKGVVLNLADPVGLKKAFEGMKADQYLVQKMSPPGCEVIIGGKNDREFGPVIVFGLGGIFVEIYRDVAMRVAPIDADTATEMTHEIRGAQILNGFRGLPTYDKGSLVRSLVSISRLLVEHPEITMLDINPLIVLPEGQGCRVVDAKIESLNK
jgi:acetate---CoA ligase (ADP-forming)